MHDRSNRPITHVVALMLVSILGALLSQTSHAQCVFTEPEYDPQTCPAPQFCSPQSSDFNLGNGCIIRVTWRVRCNCPGYNDVKIEAIAFPSGGCSGYTIRQLLDIATDRLIADNPMGFPPTDPNDPHPCASFTRFLYSTCWSRGLGGVIPGGIIYPCETGLVCCHMYNVCIENGVRVVKGITRGSMSGCPEGTRDSYGNLCEPICD